MKVKIEFAPSETGYITDVDYGMEQGIEVIDTTNGYVLIHYTTDGDYVEIFKNFKDLLRRIEEDYDKDTKEDLLNAFKEKGVREVKIDFKGLSPEVGYGMRNGIEVIDTTNGYVLIHHTIDGDYVEIFDDLKDLLKRIEEEYGDEARQALLNAYKEYYGVKGVEEMLNNNEEILSNE